MDALANHLPTIWLAIIAVLLLYYAVTDGWDLGVGMLSLLHRDGETVGGMMETISSVWSGNQTWLVILGGMLFGAFPLFYATLLSSLYVPMVAMLFGMLFRAVSFEFRSSAGNPRPWELAFGWGSLLTAVAQGAALGGLLGGLPAEHGRFTGGVWNWLTPYSVLVAAGVVAGYAMLGANYLILRTGGELQRRSYRYAGWATLVTVVISVGVHVWTVALYPNALAKWTSWPGAAWVAVPTAAAAVSCGMLVVSLARRGRRSPLFWNAALIVSSFTGLSLALYPHMIPSVVSPVTVAEAAASPRTLEFMLAVTAILLPVILFYTGYTYRVAGRAGGSGDGGYTADAGSKAGGLGPSSSTQRREP